MNRRILTDKPAIVTKDAPQEVRAISKAVARIAADIAYRDAALEMWSTKAVELARRGRSLRELAEATGLSPTYLSRVSTGAIQISPGALLDLLKEMPGCEESDL